MSARDRVGFWLLRSKRVRIDITCPHGTFVPAHSGLASRRARLTCHRCDFAVKVAVVDDPYRVVS